MDDLREEIGDVRRGLAVHIATCEGLHRDTNGKLDSIKESQKYLLYGMVIVAALTTLEPRTWVPVVLRKLGVG